jgi:DNA-directed RNA polymerase subunit RPC12/RpoP
MTSSLKRCTHQTSPEIVSYLKLFDENCRPFIDCKLQDKSHHLILMNPVQYLTISIPAEWANWYERKIEITATKQGVFLHRAWAQRKPRPIHIRTKQYEAWAKEYFGKPISMSDELYKVNEDGSLQLINSFSRTKPASKQTISLEKSPTITRSAQTFLRAFSSPLYAVAFNTFEVEILDELSKPSNLLSALSAVLIQELHPNKMLPNLLLSGIFALAALWHGWARRTSWGKLILWLIIIGVFNLAGLLTYLALNHTPVIKCPACGRKRGLEMDNCSRCGSPLPIPQRKPTDLIMAN